MAVDPTTYAFQESIAALGILVVYATSRLRPAKMPSPSSIENVSRRDVLLAILLVLISIVADGILYFVFSYRLIPNPGSDLYLILSSSIISLAPALILLRVYRANLGTARLTFSRAPSSAVLGLLPTGLLLIPAIYLQPSLLGFFLSASPLLFVSTGYVAFSEEFLFRGVIQTRFEAWSPRFGLLGTAILFNVSHIPALILGYHVNPIFAIVLTMPSSILKGYMAQQSNNILGSTLYHTAEILSLSI